MALVEYAVLPGCRGLIWGMSADTAGCWPAPEGLPGDAGDRGQKDGAGGVAGP